jgi:RNA polymerase sigma-70 factor, ECF subfamily
VTTAAKATVRPEDLELHRRELTGYCYRMLGSGFEAEDAVQETLVRAWQGSEGFEGRSSLRSWLYRIATNICLDMARGRGRRAQPMDFGPARTADSFEGLTRPEHAWVSPIPDGRILAADADPAEVAATRDTVRLAFVAALQHLPPNQRAVLIMREVLGFSAKESADALDTSVASINSALQRARRTIDDKLPERSQQTTLRALGDDEIRSLVERYVDAWERNDVDAVVAMLTEDATFSMPPNVAWFRGRDAIESFLPTGPMSMPRRFVPVEANGQVAFATYLLEDGRFRANAIHLIDFRGERVSDIVAFLDPSVFAEFGLPFHLE